MRLPRRPNLHITMKRIKLTHKRGCRGNKADRHIASPLHPRRVHTTVWKVLEESAERQVDDFKGFKSFGAIESMSPGSFHDAVDRSGPLKWECGGCVQK